MDKSKLLNNMARLSSLDKEINGCLFNLKRKLVNKEATDKISIMAGSVAEGCSLAKWFHPDESKHEVEVDIVHIGATFFSRDVNLIDLIDDKPDNLKIRLNKSILSKRCESKVLEYMHTLHGDYMDPRSVRKCGWDISKFIDEDNTTKTVLCALYGSAMCNIFVESKETIKGTAVTLNLSASDVMGRVIARASVDNVPAFKWYTWPVKGGDFSTRKSRYNSNRLPVWPGQDRRRKIMEAGCDVVPKSSPERYGGDPTTEWRWSFSCVETTLMNELSEAQKRTYFLAKIMFYKHIKPIESDEIHSYWGKTTMLWICEDFPPNHSIWKECHVMDSVKLFFIELCSMIRAWRIPHFFIPKHSLLDYTDKNTLQTPITDQLNKILLNIESYVPSDGDFQKVFRLLEPHHKALNRVSRFADQTEGRLDVSMDGLRWLGGNTNLLPHLGQFWEETDLNIGGLLGNILGLQW